MSGAARYARSAIAGAMIAAWLASGCGGAGAAKSPAYPSTPAGEPGAPGAGQGAPSNDGPSRAPSDVTPAPAPSPPPPSATAAPQTAGTATFAQPPPIDRAEARARAKDDLVRAEHELEASNARDCGTACRALGSMQRATARLCDLADSPDDRRRCDDARSRLADAQRRVLQSCGACADRKSDGR